MNRLVWVMGLYVLGISLSNAQTVGYRNSIRIGVDYMSLDAPDDLGLRYLARYARYLGDDRIVVEGSVGYLRIQNRRLALNNFYFEGRPRQRVTADLTVSFDFLKSTHHALRLGGGPSVWYRRDDVLREARSDFGQNGQPEGITVVSEKLDETNIGYHLAAEYEYVIGARTTLAARFGLANLNRAGISSIAGLNLGYQF